MQIEVRRGEKMDAFPEDHLEEFSIDGFEWDENLWGSTQIGLIGVPLEDDRHLVDNKNDDDDHSKALLVSHQNTNKELNLISSDSEKLEINEGHEEKKEKEKHKEVELEKPSPSTKVEPKMVMCLDMRSRLRWTDELHSRFLDAVDKLGGLRNATPKAVMKAMNIDGLTVFHVKSHLQTCRRSNTSAPMKPPKNIGVEGQSNSLSSNSTPAQQKHDQQFKRKSRDREADGSLYRKIKAAMEWQRYQAAQQHYLCQYGSTMASYSEVCNGNNFTGAGAILPTIVNAAGYLGENLTPEATTMTAAYSTICVLPSIVGAGATVPIPTIHRNRLNVYDTYHHMGATEAPGSAKEQHTDSQFLSAASSPTQEYVPAGQLNQCPNLHMQSFRAVSGEGNERDWNLEEVSAEAFSSNYKYPGMDVD